MTTPHHHASRALPEEVRLSWPGQADDPEPGTARPAPAPDAARPAWLRGDAPVRPAPVEPFELGSPAGLRRTIVEAYDRLADRLTQRLRSVHDDIDADLGTLRSELAGLREAVEDLDDRERLRDVRTAIEEIRDDVAGLRRAVLEGPELDDLRADVAALRTDVAGLRSEVAGLRPEVAGLRPEVAGLRSEVAGLRTDVAGLAEGSGGSAASPRLELLAPVLSEMAAMRSALESSARGGGASDAVFEELSALRADVASLRRRITLRAAPER